MQHGCCVGSNVKWNWSHSSSEYNEHPWSTCDVKEIIHSDRERYWRVLRKRDATKVEAGREEKEIAIKEGTFHHGVPDAGWLKRSHKHSYNAKSRVGII